MKSGAQNKNAYWVTPSGKGIHWMILRAPFSKIKMLTEASHIHHLAPASAQIKRWHTAKGSICFDMEGDLETNPFQFAASTLLPLAWASALLKDLGKRI